MNNSPFDFTEEEIKATAAAERLLSIEIEFTQECNYRCPYCYVGDPDQNSREMSPREIDETIRQAAELGARKVVILGGEPLLYPQLEEKLALIKACGMRTEIFTNSMLIDDAMAQLLWNYRCRVVVKLNSLNPVVQERMTGQPGALDIVMRAIAALRRAGYDDDSLLGASSVICSENLNDIVELWQWLRENRICPYFETLTPQGRLQQNAHLQVSPAAAEKVFREIARYDAEHGINWTPQPPLIGGACLRHLYSCLVAADGNVMPCVGLTTVIGNVKQQPLREILFNSQVIKNLRNYRKWIKEPCRSCEKAAGCYGCRGAAYQLTGDYLASDPLCWHNANRQEQITFLPCAAATLAPHLPPILMIDEIQSCGHEIVMSATIREDNPFLTADRKLARAAIIELAAQAGAIADSFQNHGKVRSGLLAGGSNITYHHDAGVGDRVLVSIVEKNEIDKWHLIEFQLSEETTGRVLAKGGLKLCVWD